MSYLAATFGNPMRVLETWEVDASTDLDAIKKFLQHMQANPELVAVARLVRSDGGDARTVATLTLKKERL